MNKILEKLIFIDETSTNIKLAEQTGWALKGQRLIDYVPHGHWKTQTFITDLRSDGLTAPCIIDGPINKCLFETCIETQLASTLSKGDIVILDNLSSHISAKAAECVKKIGAWYHRIHLI